MGAVLDLFAGCGGAALGLQRAGWRALACVERDEAAAGTLAAAGFPALRADVREVDWSPFVGRADLVWASPPCQPGSTAGRRRGPLDPRDGWPWTFDALDMVRPTWFLAENVLGWTYHASGCRLDGAHQGCAWENSVVPALRARFAFTGAWRLDAAERRTRGGCWSHARRGLFESQQYDEGLIDGLLSEISELYYVEAQAIEQQIVGTPEHLAVRQARSAPVIARVFATIEANVARFDKRSSVAKAMQYILNQRGPLEPWKSPNARS